MRSRASPKTYNNSPLAVAAAVLNYSCGRLLLAPECSYGSSLISVGIWIMITVMITVKTGNSWNGSTILCDNNKVMTFLLVATSAIVANWLRLVLLQTIQNNLGNHAHCINAHGIHARLLQDIVHRLKIKNLFTPANYRGRQLSSILAMYSRVTKCLSAFPPPRGEGLIWSAHRLYLYAPLLSN